MKIVSILYNDFAHLDKFGKGETISHPSQLTTNSALLLHGGADISPSIYNHPVSKYSQATQSLSRRDWIEVNCAREAIKLGIPIFGICRGAQLLCALAGGSLIQHTNGHVGGRHKVETTTGEQYSTTTCHHQMMNLKNTDHQLLAWATPKLSSFYLHKNDENTDVEKEPEVVIFPKIKALAVQGHPEWMGNQEPFVQYCLNLFEKELLT